MSDLTLSCAAFHGELSAQNLVPTQWSISDARMDKQWLISGDCIRASLLQPHSYDVCTLSILSRPLLPGHWLLELELEQLFIALYVPLGLMSRAESQTFCYAPGQTVYGGVCRPL